MWLQCSWSKKTGERAQSASCEKVRLINTGERLRDSADCAKPLSQLGQHKRVTEIFPEEVTAHIVLNSGQKLIRERKDISDSLGCIFLDGRLCYRTMRFGKERPGAIAKLPGNCEASFWDGRDAIVSIIKETPSGFALTEAGLNLVCHFLSK